MEVETSRAIAAQILRHKSFSFQEFSQRYAEVAGEIQPTEARRQDTKNRQNSIDDLPQDVKDWFAFTQQDLAEQALLAYYAAIEAGIAKECARMLLPLSTTTRLYMSGSVRSWIHYCQVRTDPATQLEHRLIAEQCKDILIQQFPSLKELL
jgi:thymidylate synthase (FAD)